MVFKEDGEEGTGSEVTAGEAEGTEEGLTDGEAEGVEETSGVLVVSAEAVTAGSFAAAVSDLFISGRCRIKRYTSPARTQKLRKITIYNLIRNDFSPGVFIRNIIS